MHPTEILSTEHKAVLVALQVLEQAGQSLAAGRTEAAGDLDQLLDFFRGFVDRCHHGKEELVLFPELVRRGVPQERGPVGVMLSEHEMGRDHVRRLQALVDAFRAGEAGAAQQVPAVAASYRALLEAHIQKEDHVLFPMAACLMDEAAAAEMAQAFDRIELEHVGDGKHEAYHRMLHALKDRYLG
ncbi:MAG TPA: hemerythrin domain-containing protein [Holophaga sp.]|nr:hemerythrin domain-containing protein [Holophaga sp.]